MNAAGAFLPIPQHMKTISILNGLIATLKDGEKGYRAAADDVDAPELQSLFEEYSFERRQFAGDLQAIVRTFGEYDPEDDGSVAGAVHRGWLNLKSTFTIKDEHAVLVECERGEAFALAEFEKALADPELSPSIGAIVREQYRQIQAAHDRIRDLRDSLVAN
jgi:uncharacterized protein (TIGR02284 family)